MILSHFFRSIGVFARGRKGNVAVLFALSSPLILLAIGVVVDFSLAVSTRDKLQAALDGAVLAGIKASSASGQTAAITVASNYLTADVAAISANPPVTPNTNCSISVVCYTFAFNANGSLTGSASYSMPTFFGGATGASAMSLAVQSSAAPGSAPVCMLFLSASASPSVLANSGTNISAPGCEIDIKSTANPAVTFNSGTTINTSKICLQGTNYIQNGGTEPNFSAGCTTATNPYAGKMPSPGSLTCTVSNGNYSGTVTLSPGVYCGGFNFNNAPTVTLNAGLYVIKGGNWNVDGGKWTGSGVTFYFADSSYIQFNSGLNMTLSAPTTGTYAGILMYEADGLSTSNFVFDDSVSENLSGFIYLPSRNITFNSTSNEITTNIGLVANTAIFDAVNWSLTPNTLWPITNGSGSTEPHLTQ